MQKIADPGTQEFWKTCVNIRKSDVWLLKGVFRKVVIKIPKKFEFRAHTHSDLVFPCFTPEHRRKIGNMSSFSRLLFMITFR